MHVIPISKNIKDNINSDKDRKFDLRIIESAKQTNDHNKPDIP